MDQSLKPLKVVIHGPPASGKTKLATRLQRRYGAHYITVKTMIDEILDELRDNIDQEKERLEAKKQQKKKKKDEEDVAEEETVEDEEEEDEVGEIETWQEQIRDITNLMIRSENGKLPDEYVVRLMRNFLTKDTCQTKGYILDGYPKTLEQAKEIFGQAAEGKKAEEGAMGAVMTGEGVVAGEGGEGQAMQDEAGGIIGNASNRIMPDYVVSLEADDEFLCERVMRLPQSLIEITHYDEINMLRRLAEFRANNTEANTVLRFFDEVGIHPILISLIDEQTEQPRELDCIVDYLTSIFGKPIPGFGLSPEEEDELRRLENEQQRLLEEGYRLRRQLLEEKAKQEYQEKMEKWAETFQKLQIEEEKLLAAQSEPLRFYLMRYVFPILSKGLMEVAKVKPDDPIDFLAEYLFKENPEGKMFDPSYTRDGEHLIESYEANIAPNLGFKHIS